MDFQQGFTAVHAGRELMWMDLNGLSCNPNEHLQGVSLSRLRERGALEGRKREELGFLLCPIRMP